MTWEDVSDPEKLFPLEASWSLSRSEKEELKTRRVSGLGLGSSSQGSAGAAHAVDISRRKFVREFYRCVSVAASLLRSWSDSTGIVAVFPEVR